MSKPGFMEKLLDGVEVAWLPLRDVTQYEQPTKYLVKDGLNNQPADPNSSLLVA